MLETLDEVVGKYQRDTLFPGSSIFERLSEILFDFESTVFMLSSNHKNIGYAIAYVSPESKVKEARFSSIFIQKPFRGFGGSTLLCDAVEQWARGIHLDYITYATAQHHNRMKRLLKRQGYIQVKKAEEMVLFEKTLP